jgi:hypothetical protein
MKMLAIMISLIIAFYGCRSAEKEDWKAFIPGVYATAYNHHYSIGWDTLIITLNQGTESNVYTIVRHNRHQRIIHGNAKPAISKHFVWTGITDDKLHALIISKNKRLIVFEPASNQLKIGITIYKKINQ